MDLDTSFNPGSNTKYDLVIIGSGISCTSSLRHLLERLLQKEKPASPVRIAVLEKDREFWTGLPYGARSSVNSLTITTLGEFIHPEDKNEFIGWLGTHRAEWIEYIRQKGGDPASMWIKNNEQAMTAGQWEELYVPRFLYGNFLREKINQGIEAATRQGIATVTLITAEAIDLIPEHNSSYIVTLEYKDEKGTPATGALSASKVLLALGSPPVRPIFSPASTGAASSASGSPSSSAQPWLYINDTYAPGLEENIESIRVTLSNIPDREKRNVLIMGSNASSLELIYMLRHRKALNDLVNHITVVSYSGLLPHRITPTEHPDYRFENMLALKEGKKFNADDLIATIEKDIDIAFAKGVHIGDTYYQLSDLVVALQAMMDWDQQKRFSNIYGMHFTKIIRRAGAEYRDAAEELIREGRLEMVKGRFLEVVTGEPGTTTVQARYASLPDKTTHTHPRQFSAVVNCGGFEDLPISSSRIIARLVSRKICEINETNRGFEVNEKLEAARNLYIMGPLLGGIFNKQLKLWHVENAKRIHTLALLMADTLSAQALVAQPATSAG